MTLDLAEHHRLQLEQAPPDLREAARKVLALYDAQRNLLRERTLSLCAACGRGYVPREGCLYCQRERLRTVAQAGADVVVAFAEADALTARLADRVERLGAALVCLRDSDKRG